MIKDHLTKINEQLTKGPTIGIRGTPVVSFWQMREKWEKYGDYWELWGQDGDLEVTNEVREGWRVTTGPLMAPAELKLIYFRIPGSEIVCQLAYEHDPVELDTGKTALRRNNRIAENLRQGFRKIKDQEEKRLTA